MPAALFCLAMDGQLSDQELMLAYGAGDAGAFATLYARHKGPLFRYFKRSCSKHDTAEELFQETWARVIKARERYEATAKFTTWMYRIAHNILMDFGRKHSRQPMLVVIDSDDSPEQLTDETASPRDEAHTQQQHSRLLHALALLPQEQREVFLLKEESGMTLPEIGEVLGVGRETVKSRLRYALKKLRAQMDGEQEALL